MITEAAYWADRSSKYRHLWTEEIQKSGARTVALVNRLLAYAELDGIIRDAVNGWRPPEVNEATPGASPISKHLIALAGDVGDNAAHGTGARALAQWCVNNKARLVECGLWMEDPRWCAKWNDKTQRFDYWCHFQIVPPNSGKRIYIPSTKPPTAPALDGQGPLPGRLKI